MYAPKGKKLKTKHKVAEHTCRSIDSKVDDAKPVEVEESKPDFLKEFEEVKAEPKPVSKENGCVKYLKDSIVSGYGKAKGGLSKAYCSLRDRLKRVNCVKYKAGLYLECSQKFKATILDWYLVLPRKGDPMRFVYLSLL